MYFMRGITIRGQSAAFFQSAETVYASAIFPTEQYTSGHAELHPDRRIGKSASSGTVGGITTDGKRRIHKSR